MALEERKDSRNCHRRKRIEMFDDLMGAGTYDNEEIKNLT